MLKFCFLSYLASGENRVIPPDFRRVAVMLGFFTSVRKSGARG